MLLCQLQWMIFNLALCSYYDIHQLLIECDPITRWVYLTLTNQVMPWSRGWNNDIVFGGKNTTSTFSFLVANRFMMARCVVFFKRSLNPNPPLPRIVFHFWDEALVEPFNQHFLIMLWEDGKITFVFENIYSSLLCTLYLALSYALQHSDIILTLICASKFYALIPPCIFMTISYIEHLLP